MRCLLQRVSESSVRVDGETVGRSGKGYLVLFGAAPTDNEAIADKLAAKIVNLRVFEDEAGKMNKSILDVDGEILCVSQFTLYADCRKGNRPSFTDACEPKRANELYEYFCEALSRFGIHTERGVFGADMKVELINDGPVTVMLDSDEIVKKV